MALDLKRLGHNIRFLRSGRGWSLQDLAERAKVSKAFLSDLENGRGGRPNVEYLFGIASALGTSMEYLLDDTVAANTEAMASASEHVDVLPPGLAEFAEDRKLQPDEVQMLAQLHFRGNRPSDKESWRTVYEVLRAVSNRRE